MSDLLRTIMRELRLGILSAPVLCQRLGVSQPTLSRAINNLPAVVKLGRARKTRYALRRGDSVTVSWVAASGVLHFARHQLLPVYPHGFVLTAVQEIDFPLTAEMQDGYFESLPYFLFSARPQGFLGRMYAQHASTRLAIATNPALWGDDDIVRTLQDLAGSVAGAFILGEQPRMTPLAQLRTDSDYGLLAQQAMQGDVAGSSAGGEFPKFVAQTPNGEVIVKFSAPEDSVPATRWKDLLIAESCFAAVAPMLGVVAAVSRICQSGGRVFFETQRFDRVSGTHGRVSHCTLADIAPALTGRTGGRWDSVTAEFVTQGWLDSDTQAAIRRLAVFGGLIGNTDMHHGNLSFCAGEAGKFKLSPIYDMLPMGYAPRANGELPAYQIDYQGYLADPTLLAVVRAARQYWQGVAHHPAVSADFVQIAQHNAAQLRELCAQWQAVLPNASVSLN